jgi:hypothetical protein
MADGSSAVPIAATSAVDTIDLAQLFHSGTGVSHKPLMTVRMFWLTFRRRQTYADGRGWPSPRLPNGRVCQNKPAAPLSNVL